MFAGTSMYGHMGVVDRRLLLSICYIWTRLEAKTQVCTYRGMGWLTIFWCLDIRELMGCWQKRHRHKPSREELCKQVAMKGHELMGKYGKCLFIREEFSRCGWDDQRFSVADRQCLGFLILPLAESTWGQSIIYKEKSFGGRLNGYSELVLQIVNDLCQP